MVRIQLLLPLKFLTTLVGFRDQTFCVYTRQRVNSNKVLEFLVKSPDLRVLSTQLFLQKDLVISVLYLDWMVDSLRRLENSVLCLRRFSQSSIRTSHTSLNLDCQAQTGKNLFSLTCIHLDSPCSLSTIMFLRKQSRNQLVSQVSLETFHLTLQTPEEPKTSLLHSLKML